MLLDNAALERTLESLRSGEEHDIDVENQLQTVIEAAQSIFDVTGTGLMCLDEQQTLRYVAASDQPGRVLELAQAEHGVGPCVDAVIFDRIITTRDIREEPRYAAVAPIVAREGVIGVLGVPVHLAGSAIGSLNVYGDAPRDWDDSDIEAVRAFAGLIENVLANAAMSHRQSAVIGQLEFALHNRVAIERAVGVLMGRDHVDAVAAFNTLRERARAERRKVADLAAEVLADARSGNAQTSS
jgi:GAF domain-containing protein